MGIGRVLAVVIAVVAAAVVAALVAAGDCGTGAPGRLDVTDEGADGDSAFAKPDESSVRRRRSGGTGEDLQPDGEVEPLRGTVTDAETDAPIAGASLTFLSVETPSERLGTASSAADGAFALDRPLKTADVLVRADGYASEYISAFGGVDCAVRLFRAKPVEVLVVDDEVGTPVGGAAVQLHRYSDPDRSFALSVVRTDAAGRATILCGPDPRLHVVAPGYAPAAVRPSDPSVTVRLTPADEIAGVVVDERGEPRGAGVGVTIDRARLRTETDEAGRFRLHPVGRGWVKVVATVAGVEGDVAVSTISGTTDLRIVIPRTGRVRGVVRYPDGSPVEDAKVEGVVTGADGAFETKSLPVGRRVLKATVAPFEIPERTTTGSSPTREYGMRGEAIVDVPPGGVVEDVEIRVASMPVSYAIVLVLDADGAPVQVRAARDASLLTRDDGAIVFAVPEAPPRTSVVLSDVLQQRFIRMECHVPTAVRPDAPPTVVRLTRRVKLDVVVVPEPGGKSRDAAAVELANGSSDDLQPVNVKGDTATFLVDPESRVVVRLHRRGECTLQRWCSHAEVLSGRIEIRDPGSADVVLQFRRGPGAIAGFAPYLEVGDQEQFLQSYPFQLDAEGRATLRGVPPGAARLVGRVVAAVVIERPVVVPASGVLDLGVLDVPAAEIVRGEVRMRDGRPAGGAIVAVVVPVGRDSWDFVTETFSASDGSFRVAVAAGMAGRIVAARPGSAPATVPLERTAAPVMLRLAEACTVRVRIPLLNGRASVNFLDVHWPDGMLLTSETAELPAAPGESHIEIRDLPATRLTLVVGYGRNERRLEVTPVPGRVTEVAFPAER